jgi:hypothetical protein
VAGPSLGGNSWGSSWPDNAAEVFVYNTGEGAVAPNDVVRVRVDPSVLVIPVGAFFERRQLQEVELQHGLREIGHQAFDHCKALREVQISDGVESIGSNAFAWCNFTQFRIPPLITTIPYGMLYTCERIFSLELPEYIIQVEDYAFFCCFLLRNVSLASNINVGENAFHHCRDLLRVFNTEEAIVNAIKSRFDERCSTNLTTIK